MLTPEEMALSFTGKCDPSWLGTSCDAHGSSPLGGARTCLHVLHLSELIRARDAEIRADERARCSVIHNTLTDQALVDELVRRGVLPDYYSALGTDDLAALLNPTEGETNDR